MRRKVWRFHLAGRNVAGMLALISTGFSWLACRFHSRAELELELIALRHQIAILNRQRPVYGELLIFKQNRQFATHRLDCSKVGS